jgi:hypothetical protein
VDPANHFLIPGFGGLPYEPFHGSAGVVVPLKNVGAGPAVDVRGFIDFGDRTGHRSASSISARAETRIAAIGVGDVGYLLFPDPRVTELTGFALRIECADVAGKPYETTCRFAIEPERAFHGIEVRPLPGRPSEAVWPVLPPPAA